MYIRQILRTLAALLVAVTMLGTQSSFAQDEDPVIQTCAYYLGLEQAWDTPLSVLLSYELVDVDDSGNVSLTIEEGLYLGPCTGAMSSERPLQVLDSPESPITVCDNGVTVTGPFYELNLGDIFVMRLGYFPPRIFFSGPTLNWNDARPGVTQGPCQDSGNGDGTETPDDGNGDGTETPDDGNGDGTETPDNGNGDSTETPDDGNGDGTETPDDGNGDGTETPDGGNGDGTETPDDGDGDGTETPDDGDGDGTQTPDDGEATETPVVTPDPSNAFTLTLAQRMCTDQSFSATWTGTNITSIQFALSNSSDDWTPGWLSANPDAGSFTIAIDHHAYDKAVALVTFADGTTQEVIADVNVCVGAPTTPPVPEQPSAPQKPGAVTSLPSTGSGETASIPVVSLMAATLVVAAGGLMIRRQRG